MKKKIVISSAILLCVLSASAQTYWQGPAGVAADFTTPGNWNPAVVPGSQAYIINGGIAEISSGPVECTSILPGRGGEGTLRVSTGGVLTNAEINVGYDFPGRVEIYGGDVLSYDKSLYAGYNSSGTGTVVMTGGTLNLKSYIIGNSGTGSFVLSNGVVNTTYWQTFIGANAGSDGTFIQEGGTNTYSYSCYLGRSSGSTGRYIMNGGTLSAPNIAIGDSGAGYMEVKGGTLDVSGTIYVGYYTSATGMLVFNNYTNSVKDLRVGAAYPHHGGKGTIIMNGGDITITGSNNIGARPECDATFIQNGGQLTCKALTLPASEAATAPEGATGTFIARSNAVTVCDGNVDLYNGGRFEIHDADVSIKSFSVRGGRFLC